MKTVTPLLAFLRLLDVPQQNAFASAVGTTRVYLYQLAAKEEPNPQLRLALALVMESARWAKKVGAKPLTLEDLLVGAREIALTPPGSHRR